MKDLGGRFAPARERPHPLGLTENEEMLLKVLDGKYFLCLVCLNPKSPGHALVGWEQLQDLIQNKRVQYQINLRTKAAGT